MSGAHVVGQAAEVGAEPPPVRLVPGRGQVVEDVPLPLPGGGQQGLAAAGDPQRGPAAVVLAGLADEMAGGDGVPDHAAGARVVEAELVGHGGDVRLAGGAAHRLQDQDVPGHYAFLLDDDAFDALLARLAADPDVEYGSGPWNGWDRRTNDLGGGRGVYVRDPNGHSYEFFTAVP